LPEKALLVEILLVVFLSQSGCASFHGDFLMHVALLEKIPGLHAHDFCKELCGIEL
jgi:hypothetical protein